MKTLTLEVPFLLDLSVSCGQSFRWRNIGGFWYAPVGSSVWKVRQKGNQLLYSGAKEDDITHYFALDLPLDDILSDIDSDKLIHSAISSCRGLRIFRQPPFECLISYICATCANIPGIQMRIENLSSSFGKSLTKDRKLFHMFPNAEDLVAADNLRSCKVGYRDTYIHAASEFVLSHPSWIEDIRSFPYSDAKKMLMSIPGVGSKVADCVLLFSFEKYESVPIDVWMERIFRTQYFHTEKKLSYETAATFAREHFGSFAGYAQEYLFAKREIITKKGI